MEDLSGSDSDEGFAEDMEAIKRACLLTAGTKPNDPATTSNSESDEEEDDDAELIRKMKERFSDHGLGEPLNLKPICALPPVLDSDRDDDSEDDMQILRAIQRRFEDYTTGNLFLLSY